MASLERHKGKGKAATEDCPPSPPSRKRVRFAAGTAEQPIDKPNSLNSSLSRICSRNSQGGATSGSPANPDSFDRSSLKPPRSSDLGGGTGPMLWGANKANAPRAFSQGCQPDMGVSGNSMLASDAAACAIDSATLPPGALSTFVDSDLSISEAGRTHDVNHDPAALSSQDNCRLRGKAEAAIPLEADDSGNVSADEPQGAASAPVSESLMREVEDLISMVPRMQLERSRSEMEIVIKRKHVLGSFLGTPKSGKSPQRVLSRTRSF